MIHKDRSPTAKKGLKASVGAAACAMLLYQVPLFEGMILRGYKDPIGIVTACAGHTKTAILGRPYSPEECTNLLEIDLAEHADGVLSCVHVPLSTGEKAAYVSFGFNVGTGAFCKSTMARKLNAGDRAGACAELSRWIRAGGKELPGLVKRRATERAMCEGKV